MNKLNPGKCRHYKGQEYEVLFTAKHSETLEDVVVYRALYGNFDIWLRPLKMFQESVVVAEKEVPRFLLMD